MSDLASAFADLGRASETRRRARSELRESVPVVITELLRHLRVGDAITLPSTGDDVFGDVITRPSMGNTIYRVDQVTWDICEELSEPIQHWDGAPSLVRYTFWRDGGDQFHADGAVLLDVRKGLIVANEQTGFPHDFMVAGRNVYRFDRPDDPQDFGEVELHLATDAELTLFANEAEEVITTFIKELQGLAGGMKYASDKLTNLKVK